MVDGHRVRGYTDKAAPFIEEYGGKLGSVKYIEAHCAHLRDWILPLLILAPGQQWQGRMPGYRVIVRASHRNDFRGLVDALPTKVVRNVPAEIEAAVAEIYTQVHGDLITSFGRYEDPTFDPSKVSVFVQPYVPDVYTNSCRGSMIEHPNRPDHFVISWVKEQDCDDEFPAYHTAMFDGDGNKIRPMHSVPIPERSDGKLLVEMYKQLRRANLVDDDLTFQVEFGESKECEHPFIYQVRAFMRKQIADFRIEPKSRDEIDRLVFGVTPPEGIELPIYHARNCRDLQTPAHDATGTWAFLRTTHKKVLPLTFRPTKMDAYLVSSSFGQGGIPTLEHNHYRPAQKASVTVFEPDCTSHDFSWMLQNPADSRNIRTLKQYTIAEITALREGLLERRGMLQKRVRIISDGTHAIVEPAA